MDSRILVWMGVGATAGLAVACGSTTTVGGFDAGARDARVNDAVTDDAVTEDAATGDAAIGDAAIGDAAIGDAAIGDAAGTGPKDADAASEDARDEAVEPVDATEAEAMGPTGPACTASSDCESGMTCLYAIGDCSAKGQCLDLASLGPQCNLIVSYCGCDGTTIGGPCGPDYADGPTLGTRGPCGPPVTVAPGATLTTLAAYPQTAPEYIAADAEDVYWPLGDAVMKVSVDGGAALTLAAGQSSPGPFAVDAANVYWLADQDANGAVVKVPASGGSPVTLASGQGAGSGIAVDAANVYWTVFAGPILKVPIAGGTPVTLAMGREPWGIAVEGGSVYYTDGDDVMTVATGGGTPVTLSSGQSVGQFLAVDSANVYWGDTTTVMQAPIGGGAPISLASGESARIALDTANVYFTTQTGAEPNANEVVSVPVGGGTPTTLVTGQSGAEGIAVVGKNVFWVNTGTGAVMKLALP